MGFFCAFKCLFCWAKSVVFDMSIKTMKQCQKDMKKRSIIIQGDPGTGKSVLTINLLKKCRSKVIMQVMLIRVKLLEKLT